MSIEDDLIVVPAWRENFDKMSMEGHWSAIEIMDARIPHLKYIAWYMVAPESKIVAYANIERIAPNEIERPKYDIFFSKLIQLPVPVPMGNRQFGQGRRYGNFERMLNSKTLDDLFDFGDSSSTALKNQETGSNTWTQGETEQHLMRLASDGKFEVTYGELYSLAGVNNRDRTSRNAFNSLIGDISTSHFAKGLPLLSVLVVSKSRNNRPGPGFFKLARYLNPAYAQLDDETIYTREIDNVRRHMETYTKLLQAVPTATYLMTWNPNNFAWPTLQDDWEAVQLGYEHQEHWNCGNSKKLRIGDRVFLMCLGSNALRGIMASGWITKEPYEAPTWNVNAKSSTALYIDFRYDVFLNPELQPLLDPKIVSLDYKWTPQISGLSIPEAVAEILEDHWQQHIAQLGFHPLGASPAMDGDLESRTYIEGMKSQALVNRYERDPDARKACLKALGAICSVCDFDFSKVFGELGGGFIHVHHIIPISQRMGEYVIDPKNDLVPVCPNCHAMLHRKSPPYSIDELKEIRTQATKQA